MIDEPSACAAGRGTNRGDPLTRPDQGAIAIDGDRRRDDERAAVQDDGLILVERRQDADRRPDGWRTPSHDCTADKRC
jgi:hypothetical protein